MQNVIQILKERGFIEAMTHDSIDKILMNPTKVYCGFDPTSDSLHLGNMVAIMGLAWFQRAGHTPVVIVGGATGLIGDPSGKSHERPLLDEETVGRNLLGIKENLERLLEMDSRLPKALYLNNYDWFKQFSLIDFLRDVGKQFRMGPMLSKDSVKARLQSEEGMSFTEFCYQLLQGYDFLYLYENHGVTVELGGSDQWGNITAGIDLVRKVKGEQVYGITFPLLTRSDGKKFGKSEAGAVWLTPKKLSSYELYQYLFRLPDADVIKMMKMLTFMDMAEIHRYEEDMKRDGYVPNTAQKKLAEEVTKILHGDEGVQKAIKATLAAKPGSETVLDRDSLEEIAQEMPNVTAEKEQIIAKKLIDVASDLQIVPSKSEIRRLIRSGAVTVNNQKINDENWIMSEVDLIDGQMFMLSLGKKNKVLVRIAKSS